MSLENIQYIDSASFHDAEISSSLRLENSIHSAVAYFDGTELKANDIIKISGSYVRIGNRPFALSSTPEVLWVLGNEGESTIAEFKGNNNGFLDCKVENENTGSEASSDLACISDFGNNIDQGYIDIGINSSTFSMPEVYGLMQPGDGYLFTVGSASLGGNLTIGTLTENKFIKIHTGGGNPEHERMAIGSNYVSISVPVSIQHETHQTALLSLGPANNNTYSLHIAIATSTPTVGVTEPGSFWRGTQCGLLRGIIGPSTGLTGWFPTTFFKQTSTVVISGSYTGSQVITSGVPTQVIFPVNFFNTVQHFDFEFYGSHTTTGNNRDFRWKLLAQTVDGVSPVTTSVIFDTGEIRQTLPITDQLWKIGGQIRPTATGSATSVYYSSQLTRFTSVNSSTPYALRGSGSFDNTKPIRLALVASIVGGNDTDLFSCANGFLKIT